MVSRIHNEDGLKGDTTVVADIDNATYRTMFHLTSDELRSLTNSSDVTARLLTAGSGTGSSPAAAFVEVEQRIAAHMSRSEDAVESIVVLGEKLEAKREEVAAAVEAVELTKQEDREWTELAASRTAASDRLATMNARIEELHAFKSQMADLDARAAVKRDELDALLAERAAFGTDRDKATELLAGSPLLDLDAPSERALRDRLDEFSDEQAKLSRALDIAKENGAASKAAYEALLEVDEEEARQARSLRGRTVQVVAAVLFPIVFVAAGVPAFIHGRQIESLSFTALGIAMIAMAFLLAVGALVVLFRPNRGAEALSDRHAISRAYEDMNLRYGELGERLEHARQDRTFDRLKLEYQQLLCELRDRKHELVTLMLAKRMLEKSIVAWGAAAKSEV